MEHPSIALVPRLAALVLCLAGAAGTALAAADYPTRKPGLWEMKVGDGVAAGGQTIQQCIDAKTDAAMREMGQGVGKDACSKQDMRTEGGKLMIDSVCKVGASTATTHAVMTGDPGASYRMESRSTYSPPMAGRSEGTAVIEARWTGPCKPGQKPGDMVMPNGMKMNVLDVMGTRR